MFGLDYGRLAAMRAFFSWTPFNRNPIMDIAIGVLSQLDLTKPLGQLPKEKQLQHIVLAVTSGKFPHKWVFFPPVNLPSTLELWT